MKKNLAKMKRIILPFSLLIMIVFLLSGAGCTLKDLIPGLAHPQNLEPKDITIGLNNIIDWMVGGVSGIATIFLLLGGLKYITSFGNPEGAQSAKKTMTFAVIAILVVWSAWMVTKFVVSFLSK